MYFKKKNYKYHLNPYFQYFDAYYSGFPCPKISSYTTIIGA